MANIRIIRDTPNLDKVEKGLDEIDPIVRVAATKLMGNLLTAYSKANNLSNMKNNKRLTPEYAEEKHDSGRNPIRDLNVTGKLTQSFRVEREGTAKYSIGPRGAKEQAIMEGNIKYDPNLMKVGKKEEQKIVDFVNDKIRKGNK